MFYHFFYFKTLVTRVGQENGWEDAVRKNVMSYTCSIKDIAGVGVL